MHFYPHIPFEVPRGDCGLIATNKNQFGEFWGSLDAQLNEDISGSIGCYIFSIRAGKGILPWYVGLAEKQSFKKECFTPHKINHYNNAMAGRKGTPLLTLISKYTPGSKNVGPTGGAHKDIQHLETMLIANCLSRNSSLLNIRDTKLLREMTVPGLINGSQGKPTASVSMFKALIGT